MSGQEKISKMEGIKALPTGETPPSPADASKGADDAVKDLIKLIYREMQREHQRYCDYPCFTEKDVEEAVKRDLKEGWTAIRQSTAVVTPWGTFGNKSYEHFIGEYRSTIIYLKDLLNKIW